ncbi:MAG: acyclic terpene utilization AtuA family protein [Bacteroidota bacterium]|nr:acyclic terpene utilization AtuA family protein [Bacteroidota bacterium]MDP4229471.1 acyclic terpene utilization AtuA family protein [Bacteroidota bacterium]
MKDKIRIASGQGFWGDLPSAPIDQVRLANAKSPIDYMMMDYLAEVTMSIMQKQKLRDPKAGYAKDLVEVIESILPDIVEKKIRVITNGGGVNPEACRDAIFALAKRRGIPIRVGIVLGDNILDTLDSVLAHGHELKNMETGEQLTSVRSRVLSANVYFGAMPIVEALRQGAQIVITGRTTDTGLTLAPMIYEFGWSEHDWDKLASGTVAGHILECGAQSSGGNFSADWKSVKDFANIGFPIAEAYPNGEFVITKHPKTGGMVTRQTVAEQLLYEIGDPKEYITPDCIADFTSIQLEDLGKDRVRVFGIKGRPATDSYKVSMSYNDGYSAQGTLTYTWPDAMEKAKLSDKILRSRLKKAGCTFDEMRTEFLGVDSCHGPLTEVDYGQVQEVVVKFAVRGQDKNSIIEFGKNIAPLILTGPPSVTGFAGGRPKPSDVVAYWPALLKKTAVIPRVIVEEVK